jgi:hypothetical protein
VSLSLKKPVSDKELADIARHLYNQGIADLQTKGLTEEEENSQIKRVFEDIDKMGSYRHIHTLRVIPLDDKSRKPYFVRRDSVQHIGRRIREGEG